MRGTEDYAAPATGGIVPPGMPGHSPGIALPYDPRAARDLLAKAGYGAGGRQPLPQVDLWHPSLLPITETVDYFIGQWRQILDVEVRVESMDWGAYLARVEQSLPHVWFGGWVADYPDPHTFLQVGLAQNRRGWPRQPYEELLEAARRVTDQPQRLQLYRQADRMAIEDAVVLPFAYGRQHLLLRPWVKRYPVFYIGAPLWKDVVIEGH